MSSPRHLDEPLLWGFSARLHPYPGWGASQSFCPISSLIFSTRTFVYFVPGKELKWPQTNCKRSPDPNQRSTPAPAICQVPFSKVIMKEKYFHSLLKCSSSGKQIWNSSLATWCHCLGQEVEKKVDWKELQRGLQKAARNYLHWNGAGVPALTLVLLY